MFILHRCKRNILVFCVLSSVYFGMWALIGQNERLDESKERTVGANSSIVENSKKSSESVTKSILYWTPWWLDNSRDWFFGSGKEVFRHCPVNNCIVTDKRSDRDIHKFDAVIFHSWHLFKTAMQFPEKRSKHQR